MIYTAEFIYIYIYIDHIGLHLQILTPLKRDAGAPVHSGNALLSALGPLNA